MDRYRETERDIREIYGDCKRYNIQRQIKTQTERKIKRNRNIAAGYQEETERAIENLESKACKDNCSSLITFLTL